MSVRECALIQTFPIDFEFEGSLGNMYKQIGNAVPVLLAQKVAEEIKKELQKENDKQRNRKVREQVLK
jgi:DNA (cytosine-5)-methyltransferase 1